MRSLYYCLSYHPWEIPVISRPTRTFTVPIKLVIIGQNIEHAAWNATVYLKWTLKKKSHVWMLFPDINLYHLIVIVPHMFHDSPIQISIYIRLFPRCSMFFPQDFPIQSTPWELNIAIENGHRNSELSHWTLWFSIVSLVYWRVPIENGALPNYRWWCSMNVPIYRLFIVGLLSNKAPCMEYVPTFPSKMTQM